MADSEQDAPQQNGPTRPPLPVAPVSQGPPTSVWDRIKRHKVVEWSIAYIAFGYAVLHGSQMLREALEWPATIPRYTLFSLLLGFPIAVTLAWYHGHRAQHRVSRTEISILVGLLLVAGSFLWWVPRGSSPEGSAALAQTLSFAKPLGAYSIAVLPFSDMSEKKDQEYFCDGMSEELIDLLTQSQPLEVVARTSSFYFKRKQSTVGEIGKILGVSNILEGSVRRSGNTVRVTVQLIRTDSGVHLWSQSYDRDLADVFKVQDDIATAVVAALKLKILSVGQPDDRYHSENPEAYVQYLRARELAQHGNLKDVERAVDMYRNVIKLDPQFARALAGLVIAEYHVASYKSDDSGLGEASEIAEKAITLAPYLPNGYTARAVLELHWLAFAKARADLENALALAPGESEAHSNYSVILASFANIDRAIVEAKTALALDPLNTDPWQNLGIYLRMKHDYSAARQAFARALAIAPADSELHENIGSLDLLEGRVRDALEEFNQSVNVEFTRLWGEAMVAASRGDKERQTRLLGSLIAKHATDSAMAIAEVYAWGGENNKAVEWLERAYRQRDSDLEHVQYDPFLTGLHSNTRYTALLRDLGLTE